MFKFLKRRKYRNDVIANMNAILLFYPGGISKLRKNYPALPGAIDGHFESGDVSAEYSSFLVASAVLTNEFDAVDPEDRQAIYDQLSRMDFDEFKSSLRGEVKMPPDLLAGTSFAALAIVLAESALKKNEIDEGQFNSFRSEVVGVLQGKSSEQRSSERVRDVLDETIGPPVLVDGDDDQSAVYPSQRTHVDDPDLNGTECKVRIVTTATGLALIRQDNGQPIVERRSLTQDDLQSVKSQDRADCRYVNLHTRAGDIVSCLIVGADQEIVGSPRAFWWALAKVVTKMTDVKASGTRMSVNGLARVHAEARAMWDVVIERTGSIDHLRDELMHFRHAHFDVITKMIESAENDAAKLGLTICKAMVLATQSDDEKLEAFAYRRFKRFLWRPGEEPSEFYAHDH